MVYRKHFVSWQPAVPYQHAAYHSYLFSLFFFICGAFILRYFNEEQYRNVTHYVNKGNIGVHHARNPNQPIAYFWNGEKKLLESENWLCVIFFIPGISFAETGKHVALVSYACTLKLYVILAQILRIWNLSLKFNIAVHNLSISPQPCLYKWQECNRCVQGRVLDSLPWGN